MNRLNRGFHFGKFFLIALASAVTLSACGGGGGSSSTDSATNSSAPTPPTSPTVANVTLQPSASTPGVAPTGDIVKDGIAYLNAMRATVGFATPLVLDTGLTTVSQNHATYLELNSTFGHDEVAGSPGFTGATPTARFAPLNLLTYGEVVVAGSPLAFSSSLAPAQILFDAPFHRIVMLDDFKNMGVGGATGASWEAFNIDFGNGANQVNDTTLIAYPYSGQTGVQTTWFANESPNPFANQPQYEMTNVGYPVTLQSGFTGTLAGVNLALTDSTGASVSCLMVTPETDSAELSNAAMCIPYAPLKANSAYTVHATGTLNSYSVTNDTGTKAHAIDLTWSFTTGAAGAVNASAVGREQPTEQQRPKF